FGAGIAFSLQSLSGKRFESTMIRGDDLPMQTLIARGPFEIGAVADSTAMAETLGTRHETVEGAVEYLVQTAIADGKKPVLLLSGNRGQAETLARNHPEVALIQYRSTGDPPGHPEHVGSTLLVTTGEHGKSIVRLTWDGKNFGGYTVVRLGPEVKDDPEISRLYDAYLDRVDQADLLSQFPRRETASFAGSAACASRHADGFKILKS